MLLGRDAVRAAVAVAVAEAGRAALGPLVQLHAEDVLDVRAFVRVVLADAAPVAALVPEVQDDARLVEPLVAAVVPAVGALQRAGAAALAGEHGVAADVVAVVLAGVAR